MTNPKLAIILDVFTRNTAAAVRYLSGRALSLAELGTIREQCSAALKAAYLAGKLDRFNIQAAHLDPWDTDNDPTDPYIRKPK